MSLNFIDILFRITIIYFLIAFGQILRHFTADPDNSHAISYLTKIILDLFFPFLVISSILNVTVNSLFLVFFSVIFCIVIMASGFLSVFFFSRFRSISRPTLGSMFFAVSFPNSVFLPFPLILILIGSQGLISATLFAVTVIVAQNSFGSFIAFTYGKPEESIKLTFSSLFKKIFFFPPTLAMIIGFSLKIVFQPSSFTELFSFLPFSSLQITSLVDIVSWISLILALILVGITFDMRFSSFKNRFILETTFFRLIVAPLFGILFIFLISLFFQSSGIFQRDIIIPLLIQAFSGPAIINIAFAKEFSLDLDAESMYITIVTLLALFFLPLLVLISFTFL